MSERERTVADYAAGRDAAFGRLVDRLRDDERCVAAWLSGAHGRGEEDEWSDFDFHLAVRDEEMSSVLANPRPWFELAGEVLLVQANFPSDSMPEGRFWLVMYPGPFNIDWNVGPASAAVRPIASRLLFEKEPIPVAEEPMPLQDDGARELAQRALEFFWAMAPIAVKYAARGWTRVAVQQEALLNGAAERLWRLANGRVLRSQDTYDQNRPPEPELLATRPRFAATIDGAAVLDAIELHCETVERLHPALAGLEAEVPERMPGEVRTLVELARLEVARGVVRPGSGSSR